jgi:hypothetical protein
MRFHIGPIPSNPDFAPDQTWTALREPTPWVMQLFALPVGIALGAAVLGIWLWGTPIDAASFEAPWACLLALLALVPAHELIHFAMHPRKGGPESSVLGFWPSRVLFYAHYFGELSRTRFIAILLMPLLVLTVLPLIVCCILGKASTILIVVSTINALAACGDVFGVLVLLFQVPARAVVRNQGWRTYWKVGG